MAAPLIGAADTPALATRPTPAATSIANRIPRILKSPLLGLVRDRTGPMGDPNSFPLSIETAAIGKGRNPKQRADDQFVSASAPSAVRSMQTAHLRCTPAMNQVKSAIT